MPYCGPNQDTSTLSYRTLTSCLACGSAGLRRFLDLGWQPLANSYQRLPQPLPQYPLSSNFCSACSHIQLGVAVDPREMFADYKYVSGTTETARRHFQDLAERATNHFRRNETEAPAVLDIGCNTGILLQCFRSLGWRVFGVDPASNLAALALESGIPVMVDYWRSDIAEAADGPFDLITACNVFAHNPDPADFLHACRRALATGGEIIIEFPYARSIIANTQFDQLYHEHISSFNVRSFAILAERCGLGITQIVETPIHGGSIRFSLKSAVPHTQTVGDYLLSEEAAGLRDYDTYAAFAARAGERVADLGKTLASLKERGWKIVGYGASAKSAVLLNMLSNPAMIDYIVDDNPLKHGLYCPGSNRPIEPAERLREETGQIAVLILSWNFQDEILGRLRATLPPRAHPLYATYVPEVRVESL